MPWNAFLLFSAWLTDVFRRTLCAFTEITPVLGTPTSCHVPSSFVGTSTYDEKGRGGAMPICRIKLREKLSSRGTFLYVFFLSRCYFFGMSRVIEHSVQPRAPTIHLNTSSIIFVSPHGVFVPCCFIWDAQYTTIHISIGGDHLGSFRLIWWTELSRPIFSSTSSVLVKSNYRWKNVRKLFVKTITEVVKDVLV